LKICFHLSLFFRGWLFVVLSGALGYFPFRGNYSRLRDKLLAEVLKVLNARLNVSETL